MTTRIHAALATAALAIPVLAQAPIVQGITQICPYGSPGSIVALPGQGVIPLVAGDDDASSYSLFAALGRSTSPTSGSVLAVGHEGLLRNLANGQFDTLQFNLQAIDWLDAQQTDAVALLTGHGEYANAGNTTVLSSALAGAGFTVTITPGVITPAALAGKGVVIIGNAWNALQPSELSALDAHVDAGGGLYLAGLGWSYPSSLDFESYPMNVLGRRYGLRWTRGGISDPTTPVPGSVVFPRFYPDCDLLTADGAHGRLNTVMSSHVSDLDVFLRNDQQAREDFLTAVVSLTKAGELLPADLDVQQALDELPRSLMLQHPQWLAMAGSYDKTLDDTLIVARAALGATVVAAFDLTPARLLLVDAALGIDDPAVDPDYRTILHDHGFVVLDNRTFGAVHRDLILDLMSSIPTVPRDLQRMTCKNEFSNVQAIKDTFIAGVGVNVFEPASINYLENQFPGDIAARIAPIFATTVCHEVAHVIDSYLIRTQPRHAARRAALLAAAGLDDLQYLRSQIGGQFFQNAPQEFFASLANEWCTDSVHTLRLALQRFAAGKEQPVLQALWMADTYGHDGMSTPLYTLSSAGVLTFSQAALSRDVLGRITSICAGTTEFRFTYDAAGNVTSAIEIAGPCSSAWTDLGLGLEGVAGVPVAAGGGAFVGGAPIAVHVHHSVPNLGGVIAIGFSRVDLPLFGGTLVPSPDLLVVVFTDASGSGSISLQWPAAAASGISTWYQAWMFDAVGPFGFAVSNGLQGVTP